MLASPSRRVVNKPSREWPLQTLFDPQQSPPLPQVGEKGREMCDTLPSTPACQGIAKVSVAKAVLTPKASPAAFVTGQRFILCRGVSLRFL